MKKNIEKRLEQLEERIKPRIIATLADFVLWHADPNRDPDAELSPQMQKCFQQFRSHNVEKKPF
jgi:hypothetical protein